MNGFEFHLAINLRTKMPLQFIDWKVMNAISRTAWLNRSKVIFLNFQKFHKTVDYWLNCTSSPRLKSWKQLKGSRFKIYQAFILACDCTIDFWQKLNAYNRNFVRASRKITRLMDTTNLAVFIHSSAAFVVALRGQMKIVRLKSKSSSKTLLQFPNYSILAL